GGCSSVSSVFNCDDSNPCTTDLCVPSGGVGQCKHYHRGQCSQAICSGGGSPALTEPACAPGGGAFAADDNDGHGLNTLWELKLVNQYTGTPNTAAGVDLNCNGIVDAADGDLIWHASPSPSAPDIFLQYDYEATNTGQQNNCSTDDQCMQTCTSGLDCDPGSH